MLACEYAPRGAHYAVFFALFSPYTPKTEAVHRLRQCKTKCKKTDKNTLSSMTVIQFVSGTHRIVYDRQFNEVF